MLILSTFKVNTFCKLFSPFWCFYSGFFPFLLKKTQLRNIFFLLSLSAVFYKCGRKAHSKRPLSATCSLGIQWHSDEISSLLNVICMRAVWSFTPAFLRKVQLCCYTRGKLVWDQSQGHVSFRCLIIKTVREFCFTSSQLLPSKALNLLWLKKKKKILIEHNGSFCLKGCWQDRCLSSS